MDEDASSSEKFMYRVDWNTGRSEGLCTLHYYPSERMRLLEVCAELQAEGYERVAYNASLEPLTYSVTKVMDANLSNETN